MEPTSKITANGFVRSDYLRGKKESANIASRGKNCLNEKEEGQNASSPRKADFVNIPQPKIEGSIIDTLRDAGNLLMKLRTGVSGSVDYARGMLQGNMPNADRVLELITED